MSYLDNTGVATLAAKLAVKVQAAIQAAAVDFTGATSSAAGAHGLVPAPASSDDGKFLKGSGSWEALTASDIGSGTFAEGRLPEATTSTKGGVIVGSGLNVSNGTISVADMIGATSSTAGAHGLVPAPAMGDQNKFLHGDGTWSTLPVASASQFGCIAVGSGLAITDGTLSATGDTSVFIGATSTEDGEKGSVPAPTAGRESNVLFGKGFWGLIKPVVTYQEESGVIYQKIGIAYKTSEDSAFLSPSSMTYSSVIRKKLWENASPSSNFAAQTIILSENVGNYLFWGIECYIINTGDEKVTFMFVGQNAGRLTATAVTTNSNKGIARSMSIDSTGTQLTFGAGYYNNDTVASRMVPSKVYGFYKLS